MDIPEFLKWCSSWGASDATVSMRRYVLTAYEKAARGSDSPNDVEAWVYRPELTNWSRSTYHTTLKAYFAWEVHTGQRDANPVEQVRRPRRGKNAPRPFTHEQVDLILTAHPQHKHVIDWMTLGIYAGLRAHEVAKMRGEDVTPEAIFVRGKGGSEAFVPTHERIQPLLERYPTHGPWWPGRGQETISAAAVTRAASLLLRSLNIEGSFHRCRHTFGTSLMNSGASLRTVQELMRHESVTSTQIYTMVSDRDRVDAIRRMAA